MAIDKAVDSAALESNLTAVANAIRAKTGGANSLAFPSGMVDAIAGITSGGGVQSGSFTPASNLLTFTVTLEKEATNFMLMKGTNALTYGVRTLVAVFDFENLPYVVGISTNTAGSNPSANITSWGNVVAINGLEVTVKTASDYFVPEEYVWFAW